MPADQNCVFCKIAAGQIPAAVVFRTDSCLAFMDIGPLADGHLLLIPVDHYERMEEMPADVAGKLCGQLPKLGAALVEVTGASGYNILQNNGRVSGQEVGHVHIHLIPRSKGDGLGYRWHPKSYPEGRAEQLAERFRTALSE